MDANKEDLSLSLYTYLCQVVGSEEVVRTRRRLFNAMDNVCRTSIFTTFISGSKGEGLDLPGSDCDYMQSFNEYPVYENIEDISNHIRNRPTIPLLMDTNDTKPGYTLLKLYNKINPYLIEISYKIGNQIFVSSKLFRERVLMHDCHNNLSIQHGPCMSDQSIDSDMVSSFYCEKWILQADEWIHRSRSSWPPNRLTERIMKFGVLFVPVGCKNSPRENLEFRISFNMAEKLLVHSFSHTQLLCYALLKTILSHFIKPQYGDLLSSYCLKTIMFWVSEESMESIWKPQNLLRCYDLCFKRLVYCVRCNTCLHYFIPELDLFEGRFSKPEHDSLTSTLESLYKSGWQCILQTSLFNSYNFFNDLSPERIVQSVSSLPSLFITTVYTTRVLSVTLLRLIRIVHGSSSLSGKEMYAIILSQTILKAAQRLTINETYSGTNKQRYRNYRNCLNHLLQGIHHDAESGWLLLASLFYKCKQYQQCLHALNYCLHQCRQDKKILVSPDIDTKCQHQFNIEMEQHVKNGFQRTCKLRVVEPVQFVRHSCIIPDEFSAFCENEWVVLPPVEFALYLRCICLQRLN